MNSQYLSTLYKDFETIVNSINIYIRKASERTNTISETTLLWLGKLKDKYEMLERFQKTRQHAMPSNQFSLEVTPPADPADDSDIKQVDKEIFDLSKQLNYLFQKSEDEMNFLVQSYVNLQNHINSMNKQFNELYDKM
jgi:hypothetical protein